ncbi:MAG: efflux RND transporter periplasmic adaptor subunit [Elainellaceae cyanobacterium]
MTHPTQESAISPSSDREASSSTPSSSSKRPWLIGLGIILLLVGGGVGWRWWMSSQAGGGAPEGMMMPGGGLPVQLETVERSPIEESSEFIGNLESRNSVSLRPEIEGRVVEIYAEPGQQVEAGTPIVQLSPDELQADLASLLADINSARAIRASSASEVDALVADRVAAVAEVDLQQEEFNRASALVEEGAFPQQQLDLAARNLDSAIAQLNALDQRIEAARANLAESEAALERAQADAASANARLQDTVVVAPFSGTLGDIPVKVGDFVSRGDILTSVTQDQTLELRLSVPIERRPLMRNGLPVELVDTQGTTLRQGQVSFIAPQVEPGAQTVLAKASFSNGDRRLLDGQSVRARMIWNQENGILIPTEAIARIAGQTFVYIAVAPPPSEDGSEGPALIAQQRQVTLGSIQGNRYQVLEGLEPGEQLIVSGILNLSDGVPIMPQEQEAAEEAPPAPEANK